MGTLGIFHGDSGYVAALIGRNPSLSFILLGTKTTRRKNLYQKSSKSVTDFLVFTRPPRHFGGSMGRLTSHPENLRAPTAEFFRLLPRTIVRLAPLRDTALLKERTQQSTSTFRLLSLPSFAERTPTRDRKLDRFICENHTDRLLSIDLFWLSSFAHGRVGSGREGRSDAGLGGKGRCERSVERRRQWHRPGEIREQCVFRQPSVSEIRTRFPLLFRNTPPLSVCSM